MFLSILFIFYHHVGGGCQIVGYLHYIGNPAPTKLADPPIGTTFGTEH